MTPEAIKLILLDMLSTARPVDLDCLRRFQPADWAALNRTARQHRVLPLLRHRLSRAGGGWSVPDAVRQTWDAAFRQSAMRMLKHQGLLLKVDALLRREEIGYAALKGAGLVWTMYPNPAMRPMRDLDILVAPSDAERTYSVLIKEGFTHFKDDETPVEYRLANHIHLPPLVAPNGHISVEVHHHLVHASLTHSEQDNFDDPERLLGTCATQLVGHQPIAVLSDNDALLYLIIHAAEDHRFDNGPLILEDIAVLLACGQFDWPRFWRMAEASGVGRSCALVFDLVEDYHGPQPVAARPASLAPTPPHLRRKAALLMLQDYDDRGQVELAINLANSAQRNRPNSGFLLRARQRLNPPRHIVQAFNRQYSDREWAWWFYPRWLLGRSVSAVFAWSRPALRAEIQRGIEVNRWLRHIG